MFVNYKTAVRVSLENIVSADILFIVRQFGSVEVVNGFFQALLTTIRDIKKASMFDVDGSMAIRGTVPNR
jgi:hypothetical protein